MGQFGWPPGLRESPDGSAFLTSVAWSSTYTYNIYHATSWFEPSKLVTHLWSLCVEEQFYLVFPILIAATPGKYLKHILVATILTAPVIRDFTQKIVQQQGFANLGTDPELVIYVSTLSHIDAFAIGGLFALCKMETTTRKMSLALILCIVSGFLSQKIVSGSILPIGALGFPAFLAGKPILGYSLLNATFAYVIKHVASDRCTSKILSWRTLLYLGEISYGLYLFHLPCMLIAERLLPPGKSALLELTALCMTLAAAALTYHTFERPFISMKDRFFPRARPKIDT